MEGKSVAILEEIHEVYLRTLLECFKGACSKSEVRINLDSNFSDESPEGCSRDEDIDSLLVALDLAQSNGSWPVSNGLIVTLLKLSVLLLSGRGIIYR